MKPRPCRSEWKAAWREVGGQRFFARSRWEANYARFLEHQRVAGEISAWAHEPKTFWFEGIRRGVCSYLPDFRVTLNFGAIEWHEVKGHMDQRSRTKLKRMAKYFPAEKVVVIEAEWFKANGARLRAIIPGWERNGSTGGNL